MAKAKNGTAVDVKKAAANDKSEPGGNGKAEKTKAVKIQMLTPANTKLVKRGFVKMFVDFVVKHGSVTTDDLAAEFAGRQVKGKKITKQRVLRYANWCVNKGVTVRFAMKSPHSLNTASEWEFHGFSNRNLEKIVTRRRNPHF